MQGPPHRGSSSPAQPEPQSSSDHLLPSLPPPLLLPWQNLAVITSLAGCPERKHGGWKVQVGGIAQTPGAGTPLRGPRGPQVGCVDPTARDGRVVRV